MRKKYEWSYEMSWATEGVQWKSIREEHSIQETFQLSCLHVIYINWIDID